MTASTTQNLPWTRLLLIVSAGIAVLAVGMSAFRSEDGIVPPVAEAEKAPGLDQIIAKLQERLKREPSSAEGWRLLGWTYSQAGRHADAVTAYRRAVALEPDTAELWSALGEALLLASQQGFPEEARAAFAKALSLDPKNVGARYFLGAAKAESGDAGGAIEDWTALLNDGPPDAPWAPAVRQKIEEVAAAKGIDPPSGKPKP